MTTVPNEHDLRALYTMAITQPFRTGQTVALIDRLSGFVNTFPVEKLTPTGLVRVYGDLYTANGFRKGNGTSERRIVPITPEIQQLLDHRQIRRTLAKRMEYAATGSLPLDTLREIQSLLDKASATRVDA